MCHSSLDKEVVMAGPGPQPSVVQGGNINARYYDTHGTYCDNRRTNGAFRSRL